MPIVKQPKFIYLDNNATTRTCDEAAQVMTDWIQSCSNASGSSWLSNAAKSLISSSQKLVNTTCSLKNDYYVLFTSGASESNCSLINMVARAWKCRTGSVPHIVCSSIEHKSSIECIDALADAGDITVTYVDPNMYGAVDPDAVERAIQPSTALVTVMFANNELGTINAVRRIGEIAHKHNVPFHTDAVQMFGKIKIDVPSFNIDALSASFHKLYGPAGVGLLIIKKAFVEGYGLKSHIAGSQQYGLRGGTENVPGIAGAAVALVHNFKNRNQKNAHLLKMRNMLIAGFAKSFPLVPYTEFYAKTETSGTGKAICILGPPADQKNSYLPNTVLLSVIDYDKPFCNVKFKKALEERRVLVSIGSACNTSSANASHVVTAIKAPDVVKRGVLRISTGDFNTLDEIREFIRVFTETVKKM